MKSFTAGLQRYGILLIYLNKYVQWKWIQKKNKGVLQQHDQPTEKLKLLGSVEG